MKLLPVLTLSLALGLGSAAVLHAQDAPTPTDTKPAKPAKTPKLTGVWGKMTSLTPEQKTQIAAIHKQALADKKKIDEKEQEDITALLTPEQKTEMEKVKEEGTAAGKKKKAAEGTPSTQPTDIGM